MTFRDVAIAGLVCIATLAILMTTGCAGPTEAAGMPGPGGQGTNSGSDATTIRAVSVVPDRIQPGDQTELVCDATAKDGAALTYQWTASQGVITGKGATVQWTAPDQEGLFRVSVSIDDGKGGTDVQSVTLTVRSNSAPHFQSVPSFPQGVRPGASVSLSCPAADADRDEVTYEWLATYGQVRGEGDTVTWIAPTNLGSYVVTVVARDPFGGEARRDILISVTPGLSPKLGEFKVEPIEHDRLKFALGVWDMYIGESCRIECTVLEGEGPFTYTWTVDEGVLTADGSTARWEAPTVRGPATIKVDVTDAQGNTTSGQLLMFAEDCTCAFD